MRDAGPAFVAGSRTDWPTHAGELGAFQADVRRRLLALIGGPPGAPPLNLQVVDSIRAEPGLVRHKLRYGSAADDVVWAWLFVPEDLPAPAPAVICLAGSFMTPNWGKDAPAGLAGPERPGDPEAYGLDLARSGFVTLCPDHPCCGERTPAGRRSHDTTELEARLPSTTRVGLSAWDVERAVNVLQARPEVDGSRIGACGWSQGGQMAIIGAALEARIGAVVSICGWGPLRGVGGARAANWARSYNFPRLAPCLEKGTPLPVDFDEFVAALAPRPFLDVRAAGDATFPNRSAQADALGRLAALWEAAGAPERFAAVEVPGEHAHGAEAARREQEWLARWLRLPAA